jgi:hypothetical protein
MKKSQLTTEQYNEIKRELIGNDYLTYSTKLGLIKIDRDSFEKTYIRIYFENRDVRLTVDNTFFTKLAAILGLKRNVISKKVNDELLATLITTINSIASNFDVTLTIDTGNKRVIDINEGGSNRLSNKLVLSITEALLNEYPDLEMDEIKTTGGDFAIKIMAGNIFDIAGIADEAHKFGIVLSNDKNGTHLSDFAYRLVCSNGMMGIRTDERLRLNGNNSDDIALLYSKITEMSSHNFIPEDFEDKILKAKDIPASLAEVEFAINAVKKKIFHADENARQMLMDSMVANHFPDYLKVINRIKTKGYDPNELNKFQKSKIRTNTKLWDLINEMTWLGSHKTEYNITTNTRLQKDASKLMSGMDHLDTEFYFV